MKRHLWPQLLLVSRGARFAPSSLTNGSCIVDADWVDDHNFEFGTAHVFSHRKRRRDSSSDLGVACGEHQNVGCFFTGRIRGPRPRFGVS